jgi:hypothetical protein
MAEIPLDKLKVGDRVLAHQFGRPGELGKTSFKGTVSDIIREPPYRVRGRRVEEVKVWLDTGRGAARDIGLNFTVGTAPQWVFVEDPTVSKEEKTAVLGLAHVARRKNLPEDVEGVIKGYVARKTGKARRSVRKQTRRRRVVRRLVRT